ncbi:hypothetical protein DSM14862_03589 (plasmid) [Sulfitobacter indolifex]|uniref:Uncharacterized protein n=1 Tax=Sulfitobacter indolifex HEL-45 TaxID=391624 RepID=A0ABP2D4J3_9RHOB|nr:hypothetical protein [Sulfitobacter indolifex]EDQ03198.1 hypothetical protein OIHEL45_19356 [Sulfitobacter indolifex HEL-45]UOA20751.1 hypothetical protein DSM14862_03589 [Sulfitobacter indolifex]
MEGLLGQVELAKVFSVRLAGEGMPNDAILRESWLSALALDGLTLRALGYANDDADDVVNRLRKSDVERLDQQITAAERARARGYCRSDCA